MGPWPCIDHGSYIWQAIARPVPWTNWPSFKTAESDSSNHIQTGSSFMPLKDFYSTCKLRLFLKPLWNNCKSLKHVHKTSVFELWAHRSSTQTGSTLWLRQALLWLDELMEGRCVSRWARWLIAQPIREASAARPLCTNTETPNPREMTEKHWGRGKNWWH